MPEARVVDTNVLIVASAADDGSPFKPDATPVQEAALRDQVLDWVQSLESDQERHVVMDYDWVICGEYLNKLTEQDYGFLAMMSKRDRNEVVWVGLELDADGHAILEPELAAAVTDLADRKMVAGALAAQADGMTCELVNACDTDWLDCAEVLARSGIKVQNIIEEWLKVKHAAKKA